MTYTVTIYRHGPQAGPNAPGEEHEFTNEDEAQEFYTRYPVGWAELSGSEEG